MANYTPQSKHENDLIQAKARYGKYEAAYNEQFACDPEPANRRYNETAPANAKQWERLENFRGNDRDARAAHLDSPNVSNQPTPKEEKMWALNQAHHWDIDRQPDSVLDHANSKNKWLPPLSADRQDNREKANAYAESIEAKFGPQYDAYAAKAGTKAVDKFDYLNTMAVVEGESLRSQKQSQQQAQSAQQAPAQQVPQQAAQHAPAQQAQAPAAQQAPAQEAQPAARSRLSVASFNVDPQAFVDSRVKAQEGKTDAELGQTKAQAESEHRAMAEKDGKAAMFKGPIAEAAPQVEQWNAYKAQEASQVEQRKQDVLVDSQTQKHTRQQ